MYEGAFVMRISLDLRYKTESGGSHHVKAIASRLIALDSENEYTLVKYRSQQFEFAKKAKNLIHAPELPNAIELLWTICVLPGILARNGISVHHGMKAPIPYYAPCPTVTTMHSTHDNYKGEYFIKPSMRMYFKLYGNRVWQRARAIIAVSHFLKECLTEHHHVEADKVFVVHNAADQQFRVMPKADYQKTLQKFALAPGYILSVGNVTVVKNHICVVKALKELLPEFDAHLVIAGATQHLNSTYSELKDYINRNQLGPRVHFLGFVTREDVAGLLNGARVMAFPSLHEGCPLTVIEAFKCGLPVVSSAAGPLPEVCSGAALLLSDPRNYQELAGMLRRLIEDDRLHSEMRKKGLEVATRYSWDDAARKHIEVYRRCAAVAT